MTAVLSGADLLHAAARIASTRGEYVEARYLGVAACSHEHGVCDGSCAPEIEARRYLEIGR